MTATSRTGTIWLVSSRGAGKTTVTALLLRFYEPQRGEILFDGVPIRDVPLEKIVLETDAPFLAPVPMRGKRNEPAFVVHVARFLAQERDLTFGEIAAATTRTARCLFGLPEA